MENIEIYLDKLMSTAEYLSKRGFIVNTGGNISVRLKSKVLITASGSSLAKLSSDDIIAVNEDGTVKGQPSIEIGLHLGVYKKRSDIFAIIHVHSPYATALACSSRLKKKLPALTAQFVIDAGDVPVLPYELPGSHTLAEKVGIVADNEDVCAILLQNHGLLVLGSDLREAVKVLEAVEENARLFVLAGSEVQPLSDKQAADIYALYKNKKSNTDGENR